MCLKVDVCAKPKKADKDGFCIGWKVLTDKNNGIYISGYVYKEGLNCANYICGITDGEVYSGLHLFVTREHARMERNACSCTRPTDVFKVVKVFYKPEDVIAYGTFNKYKSLVVSRLIVKSLKAIS